jgi:predicted RND superfamily exporter protein
MYLAGFPAVAGMSGYYDGNSDLQLVTNKTVSPNHQLLKISVHYLRDATLHDVLQAVAELKHWAAAHSTTDLSVAVTGIYALFQDMSDDSQASLFVIDMVVLPLAVGVLGVAMRSYRHCAVAISALGCSVLLAFNIMYAVTTFFDVNPFSPSIMTSLGSACARVRSPEAPL